MRFEWELAKELGINITVHVAMDRFGYTKMQLRKLKDDERAKMTKELRKQFDAEIADTEAYLDDAIERMARQGKTAEQIFDALAIEDIQAAADVFAPVLSIASRTELNTGKPSTSWPPLPGVTPPTSTSSLRPHSSRAYSRHFCE